MGLSKEIRFPSIQIEGNSNDGVIFVLNFKEFMQNTSEQYDAVINSCKDIFLKKNLDYGTSWRILRPSSITDQIYIKARRIRGIETTGKMKVDEGIEPEFIGIVNYGIMAIIQLSLPSDDELDMPAEKAVSMYDKTASEIKRLMEIKNHDYGEAWRDMRINSFTDMILARIIRIKQIEENKGSTLVSEGVDANYMDLVNYAIFALIKIEENKA